MKVDMNLLKKLREITLAPVKDCKEALVEADGDLDKAQQIMKEKGVLKAWKKADRETFEGVVKGTNSNGRIAAVKVLCETDFVAKNEGFQKLIDSLLNRLLQNPSEISDISNLSPALADELNGIVTDAIAAVGENLKLADVIVSSKNAYIYNHAGNKVAAIVYYTGDESVAKELALQVAAMAPQYATIDEVPLSIREELAVQARQELEGSGKPENVVEQIVQGKVLKTLAETVLLEQESIRDWSKKVKDMIPAWFQMQSFIRLSI